MVVQGNAGAIGVVGLDTQGRVWYGELSGAPSPARYSTASGAVPAADVDAARKRRCVMTTEVIAFPGVTLERHERLSPREGD